MHALGQHSTALLYARHGRRPPRPGPARVRPPTPKLFEREYGARLAAIVRAWSDHVETLARAELRTDALDSDLDRAWDALVNASGIRNWLGRKAKEVAGAQVAYVDRVANIPVGSAIPRDVTDAFLDENLSYIVSLKDKQVQQITGLVRDAQLNGVRWEGVADQIQERLGVTQSRAKLIARDQANKFNSLMAETTQTAAGIEEYEWVTADDYAVRGRPGGEYEDSRENHWLLRGKVFRWDSPPLIPGTSERAHPGQRIQCRCTARPIVRAFAQVGAPPRPADIVAQEREAGFPR